MPSSLGKWITAQMIGNRPYVSIGLPVFNGGKYLPDALDSLLSQTYSDFELIISDNASTDSTEGICQAYTARDQRIRYVRNETNLGASRNFNRVFELAVGKYFKWAAHDDLCAPEYLERCVRALDQDASVVLCHSRTKDVDEHGAVVRELPSKPRLGSPQAHERFFECVCVPHPQVLVFGLMRASVLRQTRLIGNYSSSDRVLLGELALRGRFHELPDPLFLHRDHPQQSYKAFPGRHRYQAWFDPNRMGKITFPHWRLLREHFVSVSRVPLGWHERTRCYLCLAWWIRRHWKHLANNLILREARKPGQRLSEVPAR
jgi:glycosyltransferase involved in cell wall biosynthesis